MRESTVTFTAAPLSADEVAKVHEALWLALSNLPHHRHRTPKYCPECIGRDHVKRAYMMLPRMDFRKVFTHLPDCRDSATCNCCVTNHGNFGHGTGEFCETA